MVKRGKAFELFEWNEIKHELRFVAPEHLSNEIRQNISIIRSKSKLTESEIKELLNKIESQIEYVPLSKFKDFIQKSLKISPPNDFPYVALYLFLKSSGHNSVILSNDKTLLKSLSENNIDGMSIHELLRVLKLI